MIQIYLKSNNIFVANIIFYNIHIHTKLCVIIKNLEAIFENKHIVQYIYIYIFYLSLTLI